MKERIERLMKSQGMLQNEFAKAIGISAPSLSSILNGRTSPTNYTVQAIHRRFPEISIAWLMFGEGEMMINSSDDTSTSGAGEPGESDRRPESPAATNNDDDRSALNHDQGCPQEVVTVREIVKYVDKPQRRITEIHVFYDDGTFETFTGRRED